MGTRLVSPSDSVCGFLSKPPRSFRRCSPGTTPVHCKRVATALPHTVVVPSQPFTHPFQLEVLGVLWTLGLPRREFPHEHRLDLVGYYPITRCQLLPVELVTKPPRTTLPDIGSTSRIHWWILRRESPRSRPKPFLIREQGIVELIVTSLGFLQPRGKRLESLNPSPSGDNVPARARLVSLGLTR